MSILKYDLSLHNQQFNTMNGLRACLDYFILTKKLSSCAHCFILMSSFTFQPRNYNDILSFLKITIHNIIR